MLTIVDKRAKWYEDLSAGSIEEVVIDCINSNDPYIVKSYTAVNDLLS